MNRKRIVVAAVVVCGVAGFFYWRAQQQAAQTAKKSMPPVPVIVGSAKVQDFPVRLEVVGRAEAFESVSLRARVDGQVKEVPFKEGQHVKEGDILVRLDPADYAVKLKQAEAGLARDQAQLAKAKADVRRYEVLRGKGFVSQEYMESVTSTSDSLSASVKSDQASADLARLQLNYTTVRAPFGGVVGAKLAYPGAAVKNNDTVLAVLNRVQPIYVTFSVPEKYLPRLREALKAGPVKVGVSPPNDRGTRLEGEANFLDNAVDVTTGTIQMKAKLANEEEKLTPGQFLNVGLTLEVVHNAVTIPADAVQQGPEGSFVFVVKADNSAEMRKIEVAATQEGQALVSKGLQGNEVVVTDGQLRLMPGAKVVAKPR